MLETRATPCDSLRESQGRVEETVPVWRGHSCPRTNDEPSSAGAAQFHSERSGAERSEPRHAGIGQATWGQPPLAVPRSEAPQ
jgi:hypothetical protein